MITFSYWKKKCWMINLTLQQHRVNKLCIYCCVCIVLCFIIIIGLYNRRTTAHCLTQFNTNSDYLRLHLWGQDTFIGIIQPEHKYYFLFILLLSPNKILYLLGLDWKCLQEVKKGRRTSRGAGSTGKCWKSTHIEPVTYNNLAWGLMHQHGEKGWVEEGGKRKKSGDVG